MLVAPRSANASGGAAEYFKALKANSQGNYGSVGTGSGGHLGMELIREALGLNLVHVPYNGGPPVVNALLGNQVQMALLPASTVMPLVQSGKLMALAVSSSKRSPLAQGVPAMPEVGAGNVDIEVWNAVMAPASMPEAHRARLAAALDKILHSTEIREKLLAQGWRIADTSAASLAQRIRGDSRLYGDLIAKKHIRLE